MRQSSQGFRIREELPAATAFMDFTFMKAAPAPKPMIPVRPFLLPGIITIREHPAHSGDLAPLISGSGYAFQICYTDAFVPEEILGRTVVIHSMSDDFTSQPSGNSGTKLACGEIKSVWEEN